MRYRKIFSRTIGLTQSLIGVLSGAFAYLMYSNFLDSQGILNLSAESVPIYTMIFASFGMFSTVSGLFLVHASFED